MKQSPQPEVIRSMFAKVAHQYDAANSVLSLGIHHLWRKKAVKLSGAKDGDRVLDCATGTGDLAIEFKKAVGGNGKVTGTDFCQEMLDFAPKKALEKNLPIDFEIADAMNLQYADNSFDITSISFGIRNVNDPLKALKEMARVTKSGGRILVLEFGQPATPIFSDIYDVYSKKVLPIIGGAITGQKKAYEYLQNSSAQFPCREEFLDLMKQTGVLTEMKFHTLSFGIAYIYIAKKI